MKAKHVIVYLLLAIFSSSCIREEAPNAEADILSCRLPEAVMTTSPIITNNSINIFVAPETDISSLAPEFTLTPGATIDPSSGTTRDFHSPQPYTVTAADSFWKKKYTVSVIDTELATIIILKIHSAGRNIIFCRTGKRKSSDGMGKRERRLCDDRSS